MNPLKFALRSCLTLAVTAGTLFGQDASLVPQGLNYQGFLADNAGAPIGQGAAVTRTIEFRLYTTASGGAPIWGESQLVSVFNGNFSVILGNGASLEAALPSGLAGISSVLSTPPSADLFFGITEAGQAEFTPRQQILASAFAFRSLQAESALRADRADSAGTADAVSLGNFSLTSSSTTGNIEFGAANSTTPVVLINENGASINGNGLTVNGVLTANGNINNTGTTTTAGLTVNGVITANGNINNTGTTTTTGLTVNGAINANGDIDANGFVLSANNVGSNRFNTKNDINGSIVIGETSNPTSTPTATTITSRGIRFDSAAGFGPRIVPTSSSLVISFPVNSGSVTLNAAGAFASSDRTLKKDILDFSYSVKDFMKIRPVSFRYLNESGDEYPTLGFIAQEIEELYPEMVTTFDNGKLGLNLGMMSSVNVAAIQAQQKEIDQLNKELSASEERSDKLEDRLKVLEALLLKEQ